MAWSGAYCPMKSSVDKADAAVEAAVHAPILANMGPMAELTADLFVSLDGFARGIDVGPYFGYGGPELDEWIQAELDKPQLVVLGRVTYELLGGFSAGSSDRLTALPKAVVSSTLSEPLSWENTRLVAGDAVHTLPALKGESDVPL